MARNSAASPLSFEEALAKLEQCVQQLEDGQIGLEQALTCYEEGVGLLKQCYGLLKNAEERIQVLSGVDDNGQPVTRPLDATQGQE
jgi:exodeoxyribonuclease VII small subunit